MQPIHPHGLLLTGGRSTRAGTDKATLLVEGVTLASRTARALSEVAEPVLVVGPDAGLGFETVDDPRRGPLVAFVWGAEALRARSHAGPILLVACDLPFVTPGLLAFVAGSVGDAHAAVPTVEGWDQPLAACYAHDATRIARDVVDAGAESMRELLDALDVRRLPESEWAGVAAATALIDVDTPADLEMARRMARSSI